jgi:hydrogenase small subunit
MSDKRTLGEMLTDRGVSRRTFLKYASYTASIMALPPTAATAIAQGIANARRQSVIWLSFQECTGCTESITRAHAPSIEDLIFDFISLDYHHTLQSASGVAAEEARHAAMKENAGKYIVVVDGSVPLKDDGVYSTIAGITNLQMLEETVKDAFAVIAVGSCAAFGGIPYADPNPTGAVPITDIITDKPVINISGCPPIPEAMRSSAKPFTTAATGGHSMNAACSRRVLMTRARARAGACSKWAARARSPITHAPRSNGTAACPSRSSPVTAAWVVPSRDSGTWAVFTSPCRQPREMP